ncbi:MAG: hypothetical protein MJZ76_01405 [Bacteroidales bacterium]|nr:hypothetical protein [Bacteroidales bacterium]
MTIRNWLSFFYRTGKFLFHKEFKGKRFAVLFDYLSAYKNRGITCDEYYEFEFEKCEKTFRDHFLGVHEQRYYLQLLNPEKYYIISRNKYLSHKVLESAGVKMATLFCHYQPQGSPCPNEETVHNLVEVLAILKKQSVSSCVIKATESSHGDNVFVVDEITYDEADATLHLASGEKIALSKILDQTAMIFEEKIAQTQQIKAFNPTSVNTLRFMTALYPDGKAKLITAFIKMGRAGKTVDNAGDGGNVDARIHPDTGQLYGAIRYDGIRNITPITEHPDSHLKFEDTFIENWTQIKEKVLRFQEAFPYAKVSGWDIALTEKGPIVVEVNDMWDRTGQLLIGKGWRPEIRDCYFAWKKEVDNNKITFHYFGRIKNQISLKHLKRIISQQ